MLLSSGVSFVALLGPWVRCIMELGGVTWWSKIIICIQYIYLLVGDFNPSEKYARQIGSFPHISPGRGEHKKMKPPPSLHMWIVKVNKGPLVKYCNYFPTVTGFRQTPIM